MRVEETNSEYFNRANASRKSKVKNDEFIVTPRNFYNNNNNEYEYHSLSNSENEAKYIFKLPNIAGPLGIHVIPTFDLTSQKDMGLVIQQIEPTGRVYKDGRLQIGDRIIEINNRCLIGVDFVSAQEVLRDAMRDYELIFTIIRENNCFSSDSIDGSLGGDRKQPLNQQMLNQDHYLDKSIEVEMMQQQHQYNDDDEVYEANKNYFSNNHQANLNSLNTKKIGKRIHIQLVKGPQGLGFKLAARDNSTGETSASPIFIKNILPKGAAIIDGRLQRGDRLLEVNGIDMTERSLAEAVEILRDTKLGTLVDIVVSRQLNAFPRELPPSDQETHQVNDNAAIVYRELLTFEIALNDTGSAGLGVSVKGKTKKNDDDDGAMIDLGIFVKTVINGGAASKDGRLKPNDQLININGFSLLGKSNDEAMQILREAMLVETTPGYMELTVSRKRKQNNNNGDVENEKQRHENDEYNSITNNNNENGVVHVKNKQKSLYETTTTTTVDTQNENKVEKINYNLLENEFIKNDKIFQRDRNYYYSLNHDKKRAFTREAPSRRSMSEKRKQSSEAHAKVKVNRIADKAKFQYNKAAGSYESLLGSGRPNERPPVYYNHENMNSTPLKVVNSVQKNGITHHHSTNYNQEKPPISNNNTKQTYFKAAAPIPVPVENTDYQLFNNQLNYNRKSSSMESIPIAIEKQNKLPQSSTTNNFVVTDDTDESAKYIPSTYWRSFRNNIGQTEYPLTNILNRRRTINRSFRKAVDKSFDMPPAKQQIAGESNSNEVQRMNYLRMSSKSDDQTKNGKKSKKSIIETFQNLFKSNKRNHEQKYPQKSNDFLRFHEVNNQKT